ncbi:MAG: hypothetical protein KDA81_05500 [Planctomycetaceae bacterium]|nr:hypothetical protein [Planctomycetaceae bacterium]
MNRWTANVVVVLTFSLPLTANLGLSDERVTKSGDSINVPTATEQRRLQLPDPPFRYADSDNDTDNGAAALPQHVRAVAQAFDNTPPENPITDAGATLGRVLFYDKSLSVNGTVSCASCHQQDKAFTDGQPTSPGFDGRRGKRNSMSLINLRYYRPGRMFWDERASSLEDQVLRPIEDPIEMGHQLSVLINQIQQDPIYPPLFDAAFGETTVTKDRIAQALAQFVRSIVSFASPYDEGRAAVASIYDDFPNFTEQQNLGKQMFLTRGGCAICHLAPDEFLHRSPRSGQATLISDTAAQTSASAELLTDLAPDDVIADRQSAFFFVEGPTVNGIDGDPAASDPGVGQVSGLEQDRGAFKVSSLRNIEVTGPYMHDGRFTTIDRVLEHYNWSVRPHPNLDPRLQEAVKGIALPEKEKVALAEFLKTLTDRSVLTDVRFSDPFVR